MRLGAAVAYRGCLRRWLPPGARTLCSAPDGGFTKLGLRPELVEATRMLGCITPSPVQTMAISKLLAGRSVAVASSTGSGKTLAYLLPIFEQLKAQEDARPEMKAELSPRAVILAPTRDLVEQIASEAKRLSHSCRVRVRPLAAGTKIGDQKRALACGADLLVATPGRLITLFKMGAVSLRKVRTLAVDEADDVLLRGFDDDLEQILKFCGARRPKPPLASAEQPTGGGAGRAPSPEARDGSGGSDADAGAGGRGGSLQVALFSATLSAEARHSIGKSFPRMELCFTPCAHRAPPTLKHRLLHVEGDRMELLLDQAKALGPRAPALVFCRGIDSARAVQMRLAEAGLSVAGCHGGMPDEARAEVLAAFAAGRHAILVATDLAARGLHLPHVGTVINFDFPASSALYLHRAGRTARYGAAGEVISLVTKRQSKAAEALQEALSSKKQIHAIDYTGKLSSTENRLSRGAEKARGYEPGRAEGAARVGGRQVGSAGMDERERLQHSRAFPYPLDYRQTVRREERRLERRERTRHAGRDGRQPSEREGERQEKRWEPRPDRFTPPPPLPEMMTLRGGRGGPRVDRNGSGAPRRARAGW